MAAKRSVILGILILLLASLAVGALAAPLTFGLDWWTLDGGGGTSQGGAYTLSGTIGQSDAETMSGGGYTLSGGFWPGAAGRLSLYLPLVQR